MPGDHDRTSGTPDGSSGSAAPGAPAGDDLLSDVLETVRLRGAVFFLWEPSWPYAQSVPDGSTIAPVVTPGAGQLASYHIVLEGPCWAAVAGEAPMRLESGDILLIPRGDAYVISDRPRQPEPGGEAEVTEFFRLLARGDLSPVVANGGPGPGSNRLICGFLGCDLRPFNPLLASLPRSLRVPASHGLQEPLRSLLEVAMTEARQGRGGTRCVLLRLSELMFVEVIRGHLRAQGTAPGGWLAGLNDPVVGRALVLMHRQVAKPWTLESLALAAGTSRTTLASRFAEATGVPPMQYLGRWRMQVAACALADSHRKVYAVAREVGYESEAAFSRAFKRIVGETPARWRATASRGTA